MRPWRRQLTDGGEIILVRQESQRLLFKVSPGHDEVAVRLSPVDVELLAEALEAWIEGAPS